MRCGIGLAVVLAVALASPDAGAEGDLALGDAAWASRAQGEVDGRPDPERIRDAVRLYESALDARPDSLEARWKLLRALHFAGDFAALEAAQRRAIFDRATEAAERGLDRLAERVGSEERLEDRDPDSLRARLVGLGVSPPDVARLHFWSAICWGAWSRDVGLFAAVQQGVANRLHDYTRVAIALEPGYDDGGALRLLGRLHAELPRVPFVSGWVDRDRAIPLIERALEMAPDHPGNQLLLALTLLDLAPERDDEARALLERVAALTPRPAMRVEDLVMREEARDRLRELAPR